METFDHRAAVNREINDITQSLIRLRKMLPREPPGDDDPSDDGPLDGGPPGGGPPGGGPPDGGPPDGDGGPPDDDLPNHDPPPNNGWWQPIFDFFVNMWGGIKSTFWDIFVRVRSALLKIFEVLGDCAHYVKESVRDLISTLQQLFSRRDYVPI